MSLKRFASVKNLRSLGRPLLKQFFDKFDAELKMAGVKLPVETLTDEKYLEGLAAVFRSPNELPDEMIEVLYAVVEMADVRHAGRADGGRLRRSPGGGKSHWLLAQLGADDCQRMPGLKCLLLRKVGKANLEHFEDLRRRLFGKLAHEFSAFRGILTFSNGSRIIAGHFQNEKDIDAYLGLEYDCIGIEEGKI